VKDFVTVCDQAYSVRWGLRKCDVTLSMKIDSNLNVTLEHQFIDLLRLPDMLRINILLYYSDDVTYLLK